MHKHVAALAAVVAAAAIGTATGGAYPLPIWFQPETQPKVAKILGELFAPNPAAKVTVIERGCPWGQPRCWALNDDNDRNEPGIGGSDGSPPDPDAPRNPNTPDHPGKPGEIWVGEDGGVWRCVENPCAGVNPGQDGSPDIIVVPWMKAPPGVWIPLEQYVADQLAALPPENPDDPALEEWVSWGLDPADFDPCAYAAQKSERENNGG